MRQWRFPRLLLSALAASLIAFSAMAPQSAGFAEAGREAPYADKVGPAVTKYHQLRPGLAAAARLEEGAVGDLKALGFATIFDLRGPDEGVAAERREVEAAGLRYLNIPVTAVIPSDEQVAEFGRIVEDAANLPILVHCGSGNRVGAMWTLYLARTGVPVAAAVAEGRAIGMRADREIAVLGHLGPSAAPR